MYKVINLRDRKVLEFDTLADAEDAIMSILPTVNDPYFESDTLSIYDSDDYLVACVQPRPVLDNEYTLEEED